MDIWEDMYNKAKKEYHREDVSPFIVAHHVVAAVESEDGKIFTGGILGIVYQYRVCVAAYLVGTNKRPP